MKRFALPVAVAILCAAGRGDADPAVVRADRTMAVVEGGSYRPLFPPTPTETAIAVHAFRLDRVAVTNGDFLAFVAARPEWRRDRVAPVFAEPGYLAHWRAADALGAGAAPDQPVVNVTWFAARAFCAARGARLPTEAEWELAASASRLHPDGSSDAQWRAEILALYSRPAPASLPHVGEGAPNYWGVRDLHGLVWEWVLDFDSAVSAFASGSDRMRFCGATPGATADATDFAAFERVAFRSSLRASFRTKNLGFRCAGDAPTSEAR